MEELNKATPRWSKTAVTDTGTALLAEFAAGRILEITAAYGSASAGEGLAELKELPDGRAHPLTIESVTRTDNNVTACIQVTSLGNPFPYRMDMVGLYAATRDPGERREPGEPGGLWGDKLLMVIEDTEDEQGRKGVTIPAETDQLYTFKLYAVLTITNQDRLEISVSSAGIATMGAIDQAVEEHDQDPNAHPDLMGAVIGAHNADQSAHPALTARVHAAELAMYGKKTIVREGDPTEETEGAKGQHYINTENRTEWKCTGAEGDKYIWEQVDYTSESYKSMRDILEEAADTAAQAKKVAEGAAQAIAAVQNTISVTPSQSGSLTYNGGAQKPSWNNLALEMMDIAYGEDKAAEEDYTGETDAGTYKAYVTPKKGYTWGDKSADEREVLWTIDRAVITTAPSVAGQLTYTGQAQTPTWQNFDAARLTKTETAQTDAGDYSTAFTPTKNYRWSGGDTSARTVQWSIGRAAITGVPEQNGSLIYTGSAQSPAWSGYDSGKLTISGDTAKTNAGRYTASFTPTKNYQWSDGGTGAKPAAWSIGKAAGSLALDKTSMSLNVSAKFSTITVTRAGNGAISAQSSNTSVATVSVSENIVLVTAVKNGSATVTIGVAEGTNHTAPASKTCSVSVTLPAAALNDNTWATIREVSDAGQGENYWSVGDTKRITINGTVQNFTFSNLAIDAFILGFNHNSGWEGTNRIHFRIGKIGGQSVALVESGNGEGSYYRSYGFFMDPAGTSTGGWYGSHGREKFLGNSGTPSSPPDNSLLAALPADLRAVMKPVTKYSDNSGGLREIDVTATTDYLFDLSEFEVQGVRKYANSAEQNYQLQYAYFKAGNSKITYNHADTGTAVMCLLRSIGYGGNIAHCFCVVGDNGEAGTVGGYVSNGRAPGLTV